MDTVHVAIPSVRKYGSIAKSSTVSVTATISESNINLCVAFAATTLARCMSRIVGGVGTVTRTDRWTFSAVLNEMYI